jgi:integrase
VAVARPTRQDDASAITQILHPPRGAGIGLIHPTSFRHTFAHSWLAQGDLLHVAG